MEFTVADFAALFGVPAIELPPLCREFASASDFRYETASGSRREAIIREVREALESDRPTRVGQHRAEIWESCWSDSLQKFVGAGYDPGKLVPDFIKPDQPIRLNGDYVIPHSPRFELDFFRVCRAYLFDRFLRDARSVYEFGCGSGFNLIALAQQLPGKKLYGLDWSKSSYETVNLFRQKLGIDATGMHFDFFNPDPSIALGGDAAVLTVCALEQVGPRHAPFVDYVLEKRPGICVNMEPLLELYDQGNPVDDLAVRYHRKRGYLEGFVPRLRELQGKGSIEIIEMKRFGFGSLFHECYSFVAWRPR